MEAELLKQIIIQAPSVAVLLFIVMQQDKRLNQREQRVDRLIQALLACHQQILDCNSNASQKEVT